MLIGPAALPDTSGVWVSRIKWKTSKWISIITVDYTTSKVQWIKFLGMANPQGPLAYSGTHFIPLLHFNPFVPTCSQSCLIFRNLNVHAHWKLITYTIYLFSYTIKKKNMIMLFDCWFLAPRTKIKPATDSHALDKKKNKRLFSSIFYLSKMPFTYTIPFSLSWSSFRICSTCWSSPWTMTSESLPSSPTSIFTLICSFRDARFQ